MQEWRFGFVADFIFEFGGWAGNAVWYFITESAPRDRTYMDMERNATTRQDKIYIISFINHHLVFYIFSAMPEKQDQQQTLPLPESTASQKRKKMVEAQFGAGSYERARSRIHPHRCARHLDDLLVGIYSLNISQQQFVKFWECIGSVPGQEPERNAGDSEPFDQTGMSKK